MTSKNPDWKKVMENANKILLQSRSINQFPFKVKEVVKEFSDIRCCTYKKAYKSFGLDVNKFGSESAIIMKYNSKQILFYNQDKPKTHTKFSILHEFGHDINEHALDNDDYGVKEIETNFFTAQLLMPQQLIRELQRRGQKIDIEFLTQTFGVSNEAAQKRIDTLTKINFEWLSEEESQFNDWIVQRFSDFLDSVRPSSLNNIDWFEDELDLEDERNSWR